MKKTKKPLVKTVTGPKYRVTVDSSEEGSVKFAVFPERGSELCEGKFREFTEKHGFRSLTLTGARVLGAVLNNEARGAKAIRTFAWSIPAFVEIDPSKVTDAELADLFSVRAPAVSAERPKEPVSFIGMLRLLVTPEEYRGYLKCSFLEKKLTGHDDESVKFLKWLDESAREAMQ